MRQPFGMSTFISDLTTNEHKWTRIRRAFVAASTALPIATPNFWGGIQGTVSARALLRLRSGQASPIRGTRVLPRATGGD